jgi:MFS family permease
MESCVLCLCVILDIPAGALADSIGKKKCLIVGRVLIFLSVCRFTAMTTPLDAWIGNILWAIGYSLQSGTDTSLLYNTLKEHSREKEYVRIEGRAVGALLFFLAFGSLGAGVLADIDMRLPLLVGLPFTAIPLITAFFFKEPVQTKRYSVQTQFSTLQQGCLFVFRSTELWWMIGFAAIITGVSKVWFFSYNPYFKTVGLPLAHYGVIFFCLNIIAWLSSKYAYKTEERLGERGCIIGILICTSIPIIVMGCVPIQECAYLVLIQSIARGFMRPFIGSYMHRHARDDVRTTIVSVQSSLVNGASILGLALFGLCTGTLTLLSSLIILGVVSLSLGIGSYIVYEKKIA